MILTKTAIENVLEQEEDSAGSFYLPLTVDKFKEFRSNLEVVQNESRVGMSKDAHKHNGVWKLDPGTYRVEFNEDIPDLPDYYFGIHMPHEQTLRVGSYLVPRAYVSDSFWGIFHVTKGVDIEEGATVGITVINRVYNVTGRLNELESRIEELENNTVKDEPTES